MKNPQTKKTLLTLKHCSINNDLSWILQLFGPEETNLTAEIFYLYEFSYLCKCKGES